MMRNKIIALSKFLRVEMGCCWKTIRKKFWNSSFNSSWTCPVFTVFLPSNFPNTKIYGPPCLNRNWIMRNGWKNYGSWQAKIKSSSKKSWPKPTRWKEY